MQNPRWFERAEELEKKGLEKMREMKKIGLYHREDLRGEDEVELSHLIVELDLFYSMVDHYMEKEDLSKEDSIHRVKSMLLELGGVREGLQILKEMSSKGDSINEKD